VWSVIGIVVLYRLMPIFVASNAQTMQACLYACAVAAVAAPLLALVGNEPRRVISLLGCGVVAIGAAIVVRSFQLPGATFAVAGIALVLAAAPARAAGLLAASAIASAMRTDDFSEMGEAWRRMRVSAVSLLLAGLVLSLSAVGAVAFAVNSRSGLGIVTGEAVLLVSIGAIRIFMAMSTGPLRRRRAFEPDRVREAASRSLAWPFWLVAGGAILLIASLIPRWLEFLDGNKHPAPSAGGYVLWLAVALVGFAAAAIAYTRDKDGAVRASAISGAWVGRFSNAANQNVDRFLVAPLAAIAARLEGRWIPAGEGGIAGAFDTTGRLTVAVNRLPLVPVVIVIAVVLTAVVGLVAPGVLR
jgi:NADH:ubiquinone oxidoreductase subunit 5 (subunit L)/multisubunit Na+/H+ antiporter MnhA subunit